MNPQCPPSGPVNARIMLVGEAPGEHEMERLQPFVGPSGWELDRMLHDAGILRSECFCTNVARERPPHNDLKQFIAKSKKARTAAHAEYKGKWVTREILEGTSLLARELEAVRPNMVIALGATALWALTGLQGIAKWRGSMLYTDGAGGIPPGIKVIPTFHPAAILRVWKQRQIAVQDLRRAARFRNEPGPYIKPKWNFGLRPTYEEVCNRLDQLYIRANHRDGVELTFDLETRSRHIACAGIAWSRLDALCIPFMCQERSSGYWDLEREVEIVFRLYRLLTHPGCRVIGQNLLYDCQYTWKEWGFVPNVVQDTMINQHALFSDLRKSLDFLASMHCDYYVFWKDEGKNWDPKVHSEDEYWRYNCEDCVYTWEVAESLRQTTLQMKMGHVAQQQQEMFWPVLAAMQQGVRIDKDRRASLILEVQKAVAEREQFFLEILGHPLNADSHKQMHALFYKDLGLPVQWKRGEKGEPSKPTLDDDALMKLARIEPCIKPLANGIADVRTLNKFLSNFLLRSLSEDGRMRCSFNIGGSSSGKSAPKTYRLSSSEDAFGDGTNLQTIPSESSKSLGKAAARGQIDMLGDPYTFPNIREIFIPDLGYTWFDLDLERADLFVVVYEADDRDLKIAMKMGVDMHLLNAFTLMNKEPPPYEELIERHAEDATCSCRGTCYWEYRQRYKHSRQFAKTFVHGTDYCGKPRTMSQHTGRTVAEIERAQRIWFGAHPGIERWHGRVQQQITTKRYVENRFGYRWHIFDRIDTVLPEAVAWVPQSTVSIVINKIWKRIFNELKEVKVLLQLHDSCPGQFPTAHAAQLIPRIKELSAITVPYEDPLIIPISIKTSTRSWGDC